MLEEVPDISYDDVGGLDEPDRADRRRGRAAVPAPRAVRRAPAAGAEGHPALRPARAAARRSSPRRSPTRLAKKVAEVIGGDKGRSYFLNIKGPELLNKYVGETERQIRLVFQRAREKSEEGWPVIVFFDEMDSMFRTRGIGHQLRHGVDDRAAAARRDRRRRDAEERHRDRRVEPRGPHRPGHPAARPARREDQDRAARRGGRRADLRPLPHRRPPARRGRGARRSAAATATKAVHGDDRAHRRGDVPRRRRQPVPRGHLPERRQGDHVLQGLLVRRHDREHRAPGQEAGHQAGHRRRRARASAPTTSSTRSSRSTRSTRTCPTPPTPTTGRRSRARRASASSSSARSSRPTTRTTEGGRAIERVATGQYL